MNGLSGVPIGVHSLLFKSISLTTEKYFPLYELPLFTCSLKYASSLPFEIRYGFSFEPSPYTYLVPTVPSHFSAPLLATLITTGALKTFADGVLEVEFSSKTAYSEKLLALKLIVLFSVSTLVTSFVILLLSMCITLYFLFSLSVVSIPSIFTDTFSSKSVGSYSFPSDNIFIS